MLASVLRSGLRLASQPLASSALGPAVRFASKKAGGTGGVTRTSHSKRLGIKIFGDQPVKAGGIILRQRGQRWVPGENAGMGRDHTIFAKVAGYVEFVSKRRPVPRTFIVVHPETKQEAFVRIQERVARKNLETLRKKGAWHMERAGLLPAKSLQS